MAAKAIDYEALGRSIGKSGATMRRWEKESPAKFELLLEDFNAALNNEHEDSNLEGTVIAAVTAKGGSGKSTFCDAFAFYLDDSVILNLDFKQPAEEINVAKTVDYHVRHNDPESEYYQLGIEETVAKMKARYRFVFLDTPSESHSEVDTVVRLADKIIFPFRVGRRSRAASMTALKTYFGVGTSHTPRKIDIFFIVNEWQTKERRDEAYRRFLEEFEKMEIEEGFELNAKIGALKFTDTIFTVEEEGVSLVDLAIKQPGSHKRALEKVLSVCGSIEKHFGLQ